MLSLNDWQLITTKNIKSSGDNVEIPITKLGDNFSSPYLIIELGNIEGIKDTWDYGGDVFASHLVKNKPTYHNKNYLRIDNQNYCYFPSVFNGNKYSLWYKPPKWFCRVTVKVYQYTGVITDPLVTVINDQFTALQESLNQIISSLELSLDLEDLASQLTPTLREGNDQQLQAIKQALKNQTSQLRNEIEQQNKRSGNLSLGLNYF